MKAKCVHEWRISSPDDEKSLGVCKKCGKHQWFWNSISKMLKAKKLKLPKKVLSPAADACEILVKAAHRAGLIKAKPSLMLEKGAVDYMYLPTHLTLDNSKLKSTGYSLKHPSSLEGMPEVIRWYEKTGWEIFKR